MEATQYIADFDRCLALINRSKELEREIHKMIGRPGAFIYIMVLQLENETVANSINAIYEKYSC